MAGIKFSQLPVASVLNAADLVAIEQGGVSKGLPASAIVEYGSNANGNYVRFATGVQICWIFGGLIGASPQIWTFPIAFTDTFAVVVFTTHDLGYFANAEFSGVSAISSTCNKYLLADGSIYTGTGISIDAITIGRWY